MGSSARSRLPLLYLFIHYASGLLVPDHPPPEPPHVWEKVLEPRIDAPGVGMTVTGTLSFNVVDLGFDTYPYKARAQGEVFPQETWRLSDA